MQNNITDFGHNLSQFLKGFLDINATAPTNYSNSPTNNNNSFYDENNLPKNQFPSHFKLSGSINRAAELTPGNLLIVDLFKNTCYQLDVNTGKCTYMFNLEWGPGAFFWRAIADKSGNVFCSISGTITGYQPKKARFGYWGAVAKVNTKNGTIETLLETQTPGKGEILDPHNIQLLNNDLLLISDYYSFENAGGRIYTIDKNGKNFNVLHYAGKLTSPVSSYLDSDNILWVANAFMSKENDGEVIRIDPDGTQTVVVPRGGDNSGTITGILQSSIPDELIVFKSDWPFMKNSAVMLLNKSSNKLETIFHGTEKDPKFYNTNGWVEGNILWFGESVNKEIFAYNLQKKEIVNVLSVRDVMQSYHGMVSSYDGIESVSVIPEIGINNLLSYE